MSGERQPKRGEFSTETAFKVAEGRSLRLNPETPEDSKRRQEEALARLRQLPFENPTIASKRFAITRELKG